MLPNALHSVTDAVEPCITFEMNEILVASITAKEVRCAFFQMHPSKSPSPDVMSSLFYQKFWNIVREDVVYTVCEFFSTRKLLKELCFTYVVLIPKVKEP